LPRCNVVRTQDTTASPSASLPPSPASTSPTGTLVNIETVDSPRAPRRSAPSVQHHDDDHHHQGNAAEMMDRQSPTQNAESSSHYTRSTSSPDIREQASVPLKPQPHAAQSDDRLDDALPTPADALQQRSSTRRRSSEPIISQRIAENTAGLCEYTSSNGRCAGHAASQTMKSGSGRATSKWLCHRHLCPSCGDAKPSADTICARCLSTSHCQYIPQDRRQLCMQQHAPGRLFCASHACPTCTGSKRTNDMACNACEAAAASRSSSNDDGWDDTADVDGAAAALISHLPDSPTRQRGLRQSISLSTVESPHCDMRGPDKHAIMKRYSSASCAQGDDHKPVRWCMFVVFTALTLLLACVEC
jgi:hypothetical protein